MDWLEIACKNLALKGILDRLPNSAPGIRELRIQSAKLNRMIMSPPWKGGAPTPSGALSAALSGLSGKSEFSIKKYNKAQGEFAAKVGEQARKVQTMADKCFKQWFRQSGHLLTNAEFQQWKVKFNEAIRGAVDRMQKQITDGVAASLTQRKGQSK